MAKKIFGVRSTRRNRETLVITAAVGAATLVVGEGLGFIKSKFSKRNKRIDAMYNAMGCNNQPAPPTPPAGNDNNNNPPAPPAGNQQGDNGNNNQK